MRPVPIILTARSAAKARRSRASLRTGRHVDARGGHRAAKIRAADADGAKRQLAARRRKRARRSRRSRNTSARDPDRVPRGARGRRSRRRPARAKAWRRESGSRKKGLGPAHAAPLRGGAMSMALRASLDVPRIPSARPSYRGTGRGSMRCERSARRSPTLQGTGRLIDSTRERAAARSGRRLS
jgi:hypothetical protein